MPNPEDLLHYRLGNGWKATASRLKEGDKILGFASCSVKQ